MTCGKGQRQRQRDCICKDGQSPEECGGCGDEPLEDWEPCMDEECAPSKFFFHNKVHDMCFFCLLILHVCMCDCNLVFILNVHLNCKINCLL